MKTISIEELIKILQDEQQKGAQTVEYKGTVISDNGNSILLTTEKQF
jgi:hypothetical protein